MGFGGGDCGGLVKADHIVADKTTDAIKEIVIFATGSYDDAFGYWHGRAGCGKEQAVARQVLSAGR